MSIYNKVHTKNEKAEAIRRRRDIVMREDEEEEMMPSPAIKTKLEVSQPGDTQEQEADRIARKVVDGGDANISQLSATGSIQSKSEGDTLHAPEGLQRQLDSSKGSGESLPDNVQQDIGGKMGADLSDVKIHRSAEASNMAESVNAKAFTHGQDIYFKNGNYDPGSKGGKELLAHEVVHTVQNAGQAQQNGGGVGRKIQRQVEDINSVRDKHANMALHDYTGLLVKIKSGAMEAYREKSKKTLDKEYQEGDTFTIGNKLGKLYEIFHPSIRHREGVMPMYADTDFGGAEIQIIEITQIRWIKQAQEKLATSEDLRYYTLRVKSGSLPTYQDSAFKTKNKEILQRGTEFFVRDKLDNGGYKLGIRKVKPDALLILSNSDYDWTEVYVKESLHQLQFDVIGVSQQRLALESNKESKIIEGSMEGYIVRVLDPSPFYIYQYPSFLVWYEQYQPEANDTLSLLDTSGDFYYVQAGKGSYGYISQHSIRYNRSSFEIVSVPVTAAVDITAETAGTEGELGLLSLNEALAQADALKKSTIDYSNIQKVLAGVFADPYKTKTVIELVGSLTNAEMEVLRVAHRVMLIKATIHAGAEEYLLRLVETTKTDIEQFKTEIYANGSEFYDQLYGAFDNKGVLKDDQQHEMALALEKAIGADVNRINELKKLISDDEGSSVDDFAHKLTDSDMEALDIHTRISAMTMIIDEAEGFWGTSDSTDDTTLVRLIRTTPNDDYQRYILKKAVHSSYEHEPDNLYEKLIDHLGTEQSQEFYSLMAEFYPAETDLTKMAKFDVAFWFDNSDTAIEMAQNMSLAEFSSLTYQEKEDLLKLMIDEEWAIGPDEEVLVITILGSLSESEDELMRNFLSSDDFNMLTEIVKRVDTPANQEEIRPHLDRIMGTNTELVKKVMDLVHQNDQDAEDFAMLLNDQSLASLGPEERVDLILRLSLGWSTDVYDEEIIIRTLLTADEAGRKRLREWFETYTPYPEHQKRRNKMLSGFDDGNRPRFLKAIGTLSGTPEELTAEEKQEKYDKFKKGDEYEKTYQVSMLSDAEMGQLDKTERVYLLRSMAFDVGGLSHIGEDAVIRLISTTPGEQVDYLFNALWSESGKLYNQIHYRLDGDNFNTMQFELQQLAVSAQVQSLGGPEAYQKEAEKMRQKGLLHPNVIPWESIGSMEPKVKFDSAGNVNITFKFTHTSKGLIDQFLDIHPMFSIVKDGTNENGGYYCTLTGSYPPDTVIGVRYSDAFGRVTNTYQDKYKSKNVTPEKLDAGGKIDIMPAIGLFELQVEEERDLRAAMVLTLELLLLAVGVGEIMLAATAVRLAFAIVETALFAGHLAMRPFRKDIMKTEEGRLFLSIYDSVVLALGITGLVRLGYGLYKLGVYKDMMAAWTKAKAGIGNSEAVAAIDSALKKMGRNEALYKKIFEIRTEGELKKALDSIDGASGLNASEKLGLKELAQLKYKYKDLSGRAFLDELGKGAVATTKNTIKRIGKAPSGVVEVELSSLKPLHDVPREGVPASHIEDIASSIRQNGYDLSTPASATKLPNGDLIITGGHHRIAAMQLLGESTIPVKIHHYTTTSPAALAQFIGIGKTTGKYNSTFIPVLTAEEKVIVNKYLQAWRKGNPGQVKHIFEF